MLINFQRNSKVFKTKMQTKENILRNLKKNPKVKIKSQRKKSKKKTRTRKNLPLKTKTKKNPLLLLINLPKNQRNKKLRKT